MTQTGIIIHRWGDYEGNSSSIVERVIGPREFDDGVRGVAGLAVLSGDLVLSRYQFSSGIKRNYRFNGTLFIYDYSWGHSTRSGFRVNEFVEVQGSDEQAEAVASRLRDAFANVLVSH